MSVACQFAYHSWKRLCFRNQFTPFFKLNVGNHSYDHNYWDCTCYWNLKRFTLKIIDTFRWWYFFQHCIWSRKYMKISLIKSSSMLLMWSLRKSEIFIVNNDYFSSNLILARREIKPNQVEDTIRQIAFEEMWKEPSDKHQWPIEQIITEAMTDNNIRNRGFIIVCNRIQ